MWISNVNVLTDDDLDHCDEALGSWPLKTMQCKVKSKGTSPVLLCLFEGWPSVKVLIGFIEPHFSAGFSRPSVPYVAG